MSQEIKQYIPALGELGEALMGAVQRMGQNVNADNDAYSDLALGAETVRDVQRMLWQTVRRLDGVALSDKDKSEYVEARQRLLQGREPFVPPARRREV